jgi:hypothetical protein
MAEKVREGEEVSKAVWGYVGVGVLWLALILTGLALERLGLTSDYMTGILPGEVSTLRARNEELDKQLRSVRDENQRVKGLIGREQATADALNICQGEKKKLEDELKVAKGGGQ